MVYLHSEMLKWKSSSISNSQRNVDVKDLTLYKDSVQTFAVI